LWLNKELYDAASPNLI